MGLFSKKRVPDDGKSVAVAVTETLPLPAGTTLLADASHHGELPEGGYRIRRNLTLDVTDRILEGAAPRIDAEHGSHDDAFYLRLRDALREEVAASALAVLGGQRHPHSTFNLTAERGETTASYSCERGLVMVRSDLDEQESGRTRWRIDLMVFIYPHPGETPIERVYPAEYNNLRADGCSPDEAKRRLRERYRR